MKIQKIVVVGQTPPPFGGQSIMIENILSGNYPAVKLYHVRMAFSKEMDEIGKFSFSKILHLIWLVLMIAKFRILKNAQILYYPPAGPDKVPVFRDIAILASTRWMFKKTIFHFHAGGVSELEFKSSALKTLYNIAYQKPDCAILLSDLNPPDGERLEAKKQKVIPYGIEDFSGRFNAIRKNNDPPVILYVGVIKQSKGILVLLEACKELKRMRCAFQLQVVGKFDSPELERVVRRFIETNDLANQVVFLGVLSGDDKFLVYKNADVFCFPTFFESETFGVVLLEAMQFSLPLVSTRWRGIPSIIENGENGFLVEPKNVLQLAEKLAILAQNANLRDRMGSKGREIFLQKFTIEIFRTSMNQAFLDC